MELNYTAQVLIDLAITLLAAFCLSRIAKRLRLPNVTGYILAGILIGPHCLKLIDAQTVEAMSFLTDAALAFIAFGVGKFFKWSRLKASGVRVVVVTVLEALAAAAAVTGTMLLFGLPLDFSLLLGAIASATAPASTLMTIKQYKAKGHFVDTVLQVVALDDAVALIAFSVCATVAGMTEGSGAVRAQDILLPLAYNVAAILVGGASIRRATNGQALLGCILFHLLFIVTPPAAKNLFGDAAIGEYFRVFISYGVIALALVMHAWSSIQKKRPENAITEGAGAED